MAEPVKLAKRLDLSAVQHLVNSITAMDPGSEIILDAEDVTHLGALSAQAIIAAANRSRAAGGTMILNNVSARVEEQLGYMGLSSEKLMEGTA